MVVFSMGLPQGYISGTEQIKPVVEWGWEQ
jgi:hypothetical protein